MKLRTTTQRCLLISLAALAVFGVACGEDDGGATFDVKKADGIAHTAVLTAGDLPGKGWAVTDEDVFDESELPDTKSCQPITNARAKAKELTDGKKAGEAQRELGRKGSESNLSVDTEVVIFDTAKTVGLSFAQAKKAYDGNGFVECFKDTLGGDDAPKGVTFKTTLGKAGTTAPNGGIAKAADVNISDGKTTLDLHTETYIWTYGNAGLQVTISGDKADVTPELAKAVVSALQVKAEKLAE